MPRNSLCFLFAASLLLTATGCGKKETPPLPQQPPAAAQQKTAPQPPKPLQKQPSSVKQQAQSGSSFDFSKKKDPFKPFIEPKLQLTQKELETKQKKAKEVLPIHQYDVYQFRLIGIVSGTKENRAMIVDPAGKGYVVRQGMRIGNNNGVITTLTPAFLEVTEQFRDDDGKVFKEVKRLTMPKKM